MMYLGLDLGTTGARAVAVDARGNVLAKSACPIADQPANHADGQHEQSPDQWWDAATQAMQRVAANLRKQGRSLEVRAIGVDATSGTVLLVDALGRPLTPGILYDDRRARHEADELNDAVQRGQPANDLRFSASYGLPKAVWLRRHQANLWSQSRWLCHQADWIIGRLTGQWGTTDYHNALKTGFDLLENQWPDWICQDSELFHRLPKVVTPGTPVGQLSSHLADCWHLPAETVVVAGTTDGNAAFLASGATRPGQDNTTYGTTMVFKRITDHPVADPIGSIYSHCYPNNVWVPGGASNTGCRWIEQVFAGQNVRQLDQRAAKLLPIDALAYPLVGQGERFPFICPQATGFCQPEVELPTARFAAMLQGTALLERLGLTLLDKVTAANTAQANTAQANTAQPIEEREIFATGGGSCSDLWCQLRADLIGRPVVRPRDGASSHGAAILAAWQGGDNGRTLWQTASQLVQIERRFLPRDHLRAFYDGLYDRFVTELNRRGYLDANRFR